MFNIVLVEPEIPQNTGNIVRTCAATGCRLHLVRPLGFEVTDKYLKRAGLDYWKDAEIFYYDSFEELKGKFSSAAFYYFTTKARKNYSGVKFKREDFFVFGKETRGLPEEILIANPENCVRIPMLGETRSLNLSNSVAIAVYEGLRQNDFDGLIRAANCTGSVGIDILIHILYNLVMEIKKIVVASSNAGKIAEIKTIFKGAEIVPMSELGFVDEIEETGKSFKENAKIKAETVAKRLNLPALSDDSGLCVEGLRGAPGIYSARFSGGDDKDNRKLLLKRMEHVDDRRAYFESAVCLCLPDGKTYFGNGRTYGKILFEEIGKNGFGYDCLFFSEDLKKSFGLATDEEKNSVSHRFRALQDLRKNTEGIL